MILPSSAYIRAAEASAADERSLMERSNKIYALDEYNVESEIQINNNGEIKFKVHLLRTSCKSSDIQLIN